MGQSLLLILFFASGAAALVYEVVWIRLLSLTFSITVYALTTALCAFMAGLGLGAGLAAFVADRIERPLVAFAVAELGIALCGLAVPGVVKALQRLIPEIRGEHLEPAPAGVRAQALGHDGEILDEFVIQERDRIINVENAPSPAATASLNIGKLIVDKLEKQF